MAYNGPQKTPWHGVIWHGFKGHRNSLKKTEMKVGPVFSVCCCCSPCLLIINNCIYLFADAPYTAVAMVISICDSVFCCLLYRTYRIS